MKGSAQRVQAVVEGKTPDRIPLFDIFTNDAVYEHFAGEPVKEGDDRAGCRAIAAAADGTRIGIYSPSAPGRNELPDGRVETALRWTTWTTGRVYETDQRYVEERKAWMRDNPIPDAPIDVAGSDEYRRDLQLRKWLGGNDFWYLPGSNFAPLMEVYMEPGLERFSELFLECEGVILSLMERNLERGLKWLAGLPPDWPFPGVFLGDDFAHKTGPYFNPRWLRKHYFPKVKRYIEEAHRKNLKVMFHSDGNLMPVIDDLAECGIDLLNPVEVAAGMDIGEIHRRYPRIVFAGGIDVTNLLPHGTPQQVRDAVHRAIEDSEGRILVGSSTEVFNIVPLENFLAMRDAAMGYRL